MSTTAPAAESVERRQDAPIRRVRRPWKLGVAVLAVAGITMSMTGCTPEATARAAVEQYWGHNTNCAMRVVDRESNFDADAVNRYSGTTGLFQIHPTHTTWIKNKYGYSFSEMKDPYKNAKVAKGLSDEAYRMWRDGWAPWRLSGRAVVGGGCPA